MNKTNLLIEYFGSRSKALKALNGYLETPITRQAVYRWFKRGYVPKKRAMQYQEMTNSKLIASNLTK